MKQKIASWILKHIILPLFKVILVEFAKSIMKFLIDMFKQNMSKWKAKEENKASTEQEKEIIRKKWDERMDDLEKMKSQVDANVDKIVDEALNNSKDQIEEIKKNTDEPKILIN
ncbi:hypothetical protein ABXT06_08885 [Flavobacterium sp. UW10123]|uniref:hypothetical protein n=1 Tax=Flavobacterium sp. UW10123 TaxID=3230800 RepID=UPI003397F81B